MLPRRGFGHADVRRELLDTMTVGQEAEWSEEAATSAGRLQRRRQRSPPSAKQAARALLSGPEGSPAPAGGRIKPEAASSATTIGRYWDDVLDHAEVLVELAEQRPVALQQGRHVLHHLDRVEDFAVEAHHDLQRTCTCACAVHTQRTHSAHAAHMQRTCTCTCTCSAHECSAHTPP